MLGFIAAGTAYIINKRLLKILKPSKVSLIAPGLEELIKTFLAVYGGGNLVLVHFVFGLVEGAYDYFTARQKLLSLFLGIITHLFFGAVTLFFMVNTNLFVGIILAAAGHTLYNLLIIKFARR